MAVSTRGRLCFPRISPEDFQHTADKKALESLKKVKGLDFIMKKSMSLGFERIMRIEKIASCLKVTDRQCSSLYGVFQECCNVLDLETRPEFFIESNPFPNAYTYGITKPFVAVTSGLLDIVNDDEFRFILGHELGHFKCGHTVYTTLHSYLQIILDIVGKATLGVVELLGTGLQVAFFVWSRRAEFSADRAGLLVCQSGESAINALMKLAAPIEKIWSEVRVDEILKQAEEFEELSEDKLSKVYKLLQTTFKSHPWLILRTREINIWAGSDQYKSLLERGLPIKEYSRIGKPIKPLNICPQCGAEVDPSDNFCTNCAHKLR